MWLSLLDVCGQAWKEGTGRSQELTSEQASVSYAFEAYETLLSLEVDRKLGVLEVNSVLMAQRRIK